MELFKKRIFKYIKNFGLFAGIKLFFQIRRSNGVGTLELKLPGLKYPVYLRRESSDFAVFEEVFIDNQYKQLLNKKAVTIIDAGANIGLTALYFLEYYPGAIIICVEAEPENYTMLLKNTRYYKNAVCLNKALWRIIAQLKIKDPNKDNWAFEVMETDDKNNAIEAVTINDLLTTYNLPEIDILKIDIEGSEKEVFETSDIWVNKVKYLMVEVHEDVRSGAYRSVMAAMQENGFNYTANGTLYLFSK